MSAIIASNIAISSASASSNRERKELKTKNCVNIVHDFDNKASSTQQKQEYAACVQHLHPTMTETDVFALKAVVVVFFVSWLCSLGYVLHKHKNRVKYSLSSLIIRPVSFAVIAAFVVLLFCGAVSVLFL